MLCQLICVDRRYQRMNCFNIRELQSLLKRKFFTDLVNSGDHRELLNNSMIGLRFKTNSNNLVENNMFMFYNFGTTFTPKTKIDSLYNPYTQISGTNQNAYTQYSLALLQVVVRDITTFIINMLHATVETTIVFTPFMSLNEIFYPEDTFVDVCERMPYDDVLFSVVEIIESFSFRSFFTMDYSFFVRKKVRLTNLA